MESLIFVLFGATGDLAKRKIIPALYNLFINRKLPASFSLIGSSITNLSDPDFHRHVEQAIHTFSSSSASDHSAIKESLEKIRYCTLDVTNEGEYRKLQDLVQSCDKEFDIPENRLFYLSVAPTIFDVIALNIGSVKGKY